MGLEIHLDRSTDAVIAVARCDNTGCSNHVGSTGLVLFELENERTYDPYIACSSECSEIIQTSGLCDRVDGSRVPMATMSITDFTQALMSDPAAIETDEGI